MPARGYALELQVKGVVAYPFPVYLLPCTFVGANTNFGKAVVGLVSLGQIVTKPPSVFRSVADQARQRQPDLKEGGL